MRNSDKQENVYFATNTFETDFSEKCFVIECTHNFGDIVDSYKGNKCVERPVIATEKVAEPVTNACEDKINYVPKIFHM